MPGCGLPSPLHATPSVCPGPKPNCPASLHFPSICAFGLLGIVGNCWPCSHLSCDIHDEDHPLSCLFSMPMLWIFPLPHLGAGVQLGKGGRLPTYFPASLCSTRRHWYLLTQRKLCSELITCMNSQDTHSSKQKHNHLIKLPNPNRKTHLSALWPLLVMASTIYHEVRGLWDALMGLGPELGTH